MIDPFLRAIRDMAFKPFNDGETFDSQGYETSYPDEFTLHIIVRKLHITEVYEITVNRIKAVETK